MPTTVAMPALSPTMTEGTLARWLVKEGDSVSAGDVIAEVETDKAAMELEAVDGGLVGRLLVAEGTEGVPVNQPIAVLLGDGEDAAALDGLQPAPAMPAPEAARRMPAPSPAATPGPTPRRSRPESAAKRILASPLARRMAERAGLDLSAIQGTGPGGRIVKTDIEAALSGRAPQAAPTPRAAASRATVDEAPSRAPSPPAGESEIVPHTTMRKTIARRLSESKRTVPHFYLTVDCEIDRLLAMRREFNERDGADHRISVNDFVVRAAALALRETPDANASWSDDGMIRYGSVDISVAVATDAGLIAPIVRNADRKGLREISAEMEDLAARARNGGLRPEEYRGGTFSISNLGMFGVREFSAIVNPPQSAILAVGAGEPRPVVKDGALNVATVTSCTLSCDHRVVDGAVGARLLAAFKGFVEDPVTMLL